MPPMTQEDSLFPHRTYCDVLSEIRTLLDGISIWNYKKTASLVRMLTEECQTYGNRMEAGLNYEKDIQKLHMRRQQLIRELEVATGKDVRYRDIAD